MSLYISCPYTNPDPEVRKHRFRQACRAAGKLMRSGVVVFSPLSHSVPIAETEELPEDTKFWLSMDLPMLDQCDEMLLLGLDGWRQSNGVINELFHCFARNKPVTYIEELDIDNLPVIPDDAICFRNSEIFERKKDPLLETDFCGEFDIY